MPQHLSSDPGTAPEDESVSHSDVAQTPEEILAYWTPERMAEAQPREIRLPAGQDDRARDDADQQPEDN